mmetsp:Transcript_3231/g.8125  ORF Transcript_3231/g.8125 Transcript_3231/m.8125 type:complete len:235 (+) Transcript_3231:1946-2650(+)
MAAVAPPLLAALVGARRRLRARGGPVRLGVLVATPEQPARLRHGALAHHGGLLAAAVPLTRGRGVVLVLPAPRERGRGGRRGGREGQRGEPARAVAPFRAVRHAGRLRADEEARRAEPPVARVTLLPVPENPVEAPVAPTGGAAAARDATPRVAAPLPSFLFFCHRRASVSRLLQTQQTEKKGSSEEPLDLSPSSLLGRWESVLARLRRSTSFPPTTSRAHAHTTRPGGQAAEP